MIRTSLLESTTYTSATNAAGVDISGIRLDQGEACLIIEILALTGLARLSVQASADGFSTVAVEIPSSINGPINVPIRLSWMLPRERPDFPLGRASMQARLALTHLTGAGATITLRSWLEHA